MAKLGNSLSLIFGMVVALALAGCGPSGGSDTNNASAENYAAVEPPPISMPPDLEPVPDPEAEPPKRYALHDAAKLGLISYEVRGNGGSSGESLEVKVQRISPEPIQVYVAPGTVFKTGSKGVQSMVATSIAREIGEAVAETAIEAAVEAAFSEDGVVQLADRAERTLLLEAYCRDFALDNPSDEDGFKAASVDRRAAVLLKAADSQGLSIDATQAAVWMDRGVTPSEIAKKFKATPADFQAASRLLKQFPARR